MAAHSHHDSSLSIQAASGQQAPEVASNEIPLVDLSSDHPLPDPSPERLPLERDLPQRAPDQSPVTDVPAGTGSVWLNGDVLMCACPDCGAPMSIRFWLMIADCWHCGISIELSEEQEREARRLMQQRDADPNGNTPVESAAPPRQATPIRETTSPSSGQTRGHQQANRTPAPKQPKSADPRARRSQAAPTTPQTPAGTPRRRAVRRPSSGSASPPRQPRRPQIQHTPGATAWLLEVFGDMPAWLVSLVFHLVFLTLLGLLKVGEDQEGPYITLSATVSKEVREGGDKVVVDPTNELAFDLPVPKEIDLSNTSQRQALARADQEARELRLDPDADDPFLPDLSRVKQKISRTTGIPTTLAVRDPRIRVEMVQREGGTTLTEAAVARGLRWLSKHQSPNGSWSLDRYNRSSGCTCNGTGLHSDTAGTSLALLPFLGAGQTHLVGRYQEEVSSGLRWLIDNQKSTGDLRGDSRGNTGMYAHGQGAIVLCEAFLMTGDEAFRAPAQKAIDFIVEAQHPGGGWRYSPGEEGDTSVLGWQLMALQSARAANLTVPGETLELAGQYLDSVQSQGGARYAYRPGNRPTHIMTAEALLCRVYLGWSQLTPGLAEGMEYLVEDALPDPRQVNFYYWYYGAQALHHYGGPGWEKWNRRIRDILVDRQIRRGHAAGSWAPEGPHAGGGGRIYTTSLAVCTLEVYYRHLPIFRQIELE